MPDHYQEKKQFERRCLEMLRDKLPSFPTGEIQENESPDFLIVGQPDSIGIEVTRIHRKARTGKRPPKEQEVEREALVAEAQRIYEMEGLPPAEVHVHFAGESHFSKRSRDTYAKAIAKLVKSILPYEDVFNIWNNPYEQPGLCPDEIDSVSIIRFPTLTQNHWFVPGGGIVQEEFIDQLQEEFFKKEQKLRLYSTKCAAHWLLIVGENRRASTFFMPSEQTLRHVYKSSFNRAFFLELFHRTLHELKVHC